MSLQRTKSLHKNKRHTQYGPSQIPISTSLDPPTSLPSNNDSIPTSLPPSVPLSTPSSTVPAVVPPSLPSSSPSSEPITISDYQVSDSHNSKSQTPGSLVYDVVNVDSPSSSPPSSPSPSPSPSPIQSPPSGLRRSGRTRTQNSPLNIQNTSSKTYGLTAAVKSLIDFTSGLLDCYDDAFSFHAAFQGYNTTPPSNHLAKTTANLQTVFAASKSKSDPDTFTWDEVMQLPDKDLWLEAAKKEISELVDKRQTWIIVPKDEAASSKPLPTTWVFRLKRKPDGTPKKRKARLCVRGDLQEGLSDVFAPVCEFSTVRLFIDLIILLKWYSAAIDFANAFCQTHYPDLLDPVYLHPPRGFYHDVRGTSFLKLTKSMYGLRDAPRLWFENLFKYLLSPELGFTQSSHDKCLLFRSDMIVIVYVDDMGVAAEREELIDDLIKHLQGKGLDLQREGTFEDYLGMRFTKMPNGSIHMTQSGLIKKIITATGMDSCNPNKVPSLKTCLAKDPDGEPMNDEFNYRSVVGMLLYLSGNTRPDITFAVSQVARFTHAPKKSHATALKMIVRYLAGTHDKGIIVPPFSGDLVLKCYVDADFAGLFKVDPSEDSTSAKSRTGFIIFLGPCPLIWKSYLQTEVSLSTLEAEYSALSASLRATIPLIHICRQVIKVLKVPSNFKTIFHCACIVFEDNNGALTLAANQRITSRTKYFNVKWHFFWQHVKDGTIAIEKISTTDQLADYLTKGLTREILERIRRMVQGW